MYPAAIYFSRYLKLENGFLSNPRCMLQLELSFSRFFCNFSKLKKNQQNFFDAFDEIGDLTLSSSLRSRSAVGKKTGPKKSSIF